MILVAEDGRRGEKRKESVASATLDLMEGFYAAFQDKYKPARTRFQQQQVLYEIPLKGLTQFVEDFLTGATHCPDVSKPEMVAMVWAKLNPKYRRLITEKMVEDGDLQAVQTAILKAARETQEDATSKAKREKGKGKDQGRAPSSSTSTSGSSSSSATAAVCNHCKNKVSLERKVERKRGRSLKKPPCQMLESQLPLVSSNVHLH